MVSREQTAPHADRNAAVAAKHVVIAERLALAALQIGALRLAPAKPFVWASGYSMPIYNDNRLLLGSYQHRSWVADGMEAILAEEVAAVEVIAGTATAGIPAATTLADRLQKPLVYVRTSAKDHGLAKQVEGVLKPGQRVVLVEDLVSTGHSSLRAIEALRGIQGVAEDCVAIFSYGFAAADQRFEAAGCRLRTLLDLPTLLRVAVAENAISLTELHVIENWQADPFGWGEANGFPRRVAS